MLYTEPEEIKSFYYQKIHIARNVNMSQPTLHRYYEIYYLKSGERRFFVGNSSYCLNPGDIVLIPKEVPHRAASGLKAEHSYILIRIPDTMLDDDEKKIFEHTRIHLSPDISERMENVFEKIEYEYANNDRHSEKIIINSIHEILIFISRAVEKSGDSFVSDFADSMADRAARYICEHYSEQITLGDVADELSLSRVYFSTRFKQLTGFGFSEYLNQVRVANASRMLCSGSVSVTDVAYKCGFNDSNYFASIFKRIRGVSPKKYQLMQSKNEK